MLSELFLLTPPSAPPADLLSPKEAQSYLKERRAWEEQRLVRHCFLAMGVTLLGGALMMATGTLAWLIGGLAAGTALLLLEGQRWLPIRRRNIWALSDSVGKWVNSQPDPDEEQLKLVRESDAGSSDWQRVVRRMTKQRQAT